jgi:hypothetical protein
MKWINENTKKSDVYVAKGSYIKLAVVKGHVNYPNDWILTTNPDILKGECVLSDTANMSAEQACKEAEQRLSLRLKAMLREVSA